MDTGVAAVSTGCELRQRNRDVIEVTHGGAGTDQPGDERALDHSRAARVVAADRDGGVARHGGGEGRSQARTEFRGELDVDEASQTVGGEEAAAPLPGPDHRLVDCRT